MKSNGLKATVGILRALGSAARVPAGAGLVGAPAAFFFAKITLPLLVLGLLMGAVFGLTSLFFGYVADLADSGAA